ncbi:MAG: hypothetical protein ACLU9S_05250 [Oscillospiraceae bacterium]
MFTLTRAKLVSIQSSVLDLCQRHADTPMMGPHPQHPGPAHHLWL